MKKYCIIWITIVLSVMFFLSLEFPYRIFIDFYGYFYSETEKIVVLGIALTLATQITGFLYLGHKIKNLEPKKPPQKQ